MLKKKKIKLIQMKKLIFLKNIFVENIEILNEH